MVRGRRERVAVEDPWFVGWTDTRSYLCRTGEGFECRETLDVSSRVELKHRKGESSCRVYWIIKCN